MAQSSPPKIDTYDKESILAFCKSMKMKVNRNYKSETLITAAIKKLGSREALDRRFEQFVHQDKRIQNNGQIDLDPNQNHNHNHNHNDNNDQSEQKHEAVVVIELSAYDIKTGVPISSPSMKDWTSDFICPHVFAVINCDNGEQIDVTLDGEICHMQGPTDNGITYNIARTEIEGRRN